MGEIREGKGEMRGNERGNNKEETFKEELLSHSWSSARNEWARLNSVTRVVITSLKCAVFAARQ